MMFYKIYLFQTIRANKEKLQDIKLCVQSEEIMEKITVMKTTSTLKATLAQRILILICSVKSFHVLQFDLKT